MVRLELEQRAGKSTKNEANELTFALNEIKYNCASGKRTATGLSSVALKYTHE